MIFRIYAEPLRRPGGGCQHPKRVRFAKDRQHDRLTFALEDARQLFESGEWEYVVLKDWCGNVIADWHK